MSGESVSSDRPDEPDPKDEGIFIYFVLNYL